MGEDQQGYSLDPRIPALLQPLFEDYSRRINQDMPGQVSACYLEGSLALGDFNPRLSDIDFLAVLQGRATTGDFNKLLGIHRRIDQQYPRWKLSGMYFQPGDLGCEGQPREPFIHYHDRKQGWSRQFGLSSVTWWILKNHGIALFGPPPQALGFTVDMDRLIQTQRENLNSYWASWTARPGRVLALLSDWGVQWTVLGVLRQFYTIRERAITSKTGAAAYALAHVPDRWRPIIREAVLLRETPRHSGYRSRLGRAFEARAFLKYIIRSCNEYQTQGNPGRSSGQA